MLKLINECYTYIDTGDYQRAITAGKKAVKLYPKNADAYYCLGVAYRLTGQLDLALSNFKKAELYAESQEDLGGIYNQIGLVYNAKGHHQDALYYFGKALNIFMGLNNRDAIGKIYNNIALVYSSQGDTDKALEYYQRALDLVVDKVDKAAIYNGIAVIYSSKGDYKQAIKYYKKALKIGEKHESPHKLAQTMLNLGRLYTSMKDYKKAIHYLEEGLKIMQNVGDKYGQAFAHVYLGWYYADINNKKLAKKCLLKAHNLFKSAGAEVHAEGVLYSLKELE